jgi:adenylylsulfate kinase
VSLLFSSSTAITITSFISPYKADRDLARKLHQEYKPALPFIEVFIDASVEECEKRDPKGLYKKARAGEIKGGYLIHWTRTISSPILLTEFTGISAPYEAPTEAEIHIEAGKTSIEESVKIITEYLLERGIVQKTA